MNRLFLGLGLEALGRRPVNLAVEAGQVVCPLRGLVDVERCFFCRQYVGFQDGPVERLICHANEETEAALASSGAGSK